MIYFLTVSFSCLILSRKIERFKLFPFLSSQIARKVPKRVQAPIDPIIFWFLFYAEDVREIPQSNYSIERSENFYRKPYKRVRASESIPQMPRPIYSSRRKRFGSDSLRESANNKNNSYDSDSEIIANDRVSRVLSGADNGLSEEKKEHIRISQVDRKKDFVYIDRIDGKRTNVLQGLELHTRVFNTEEQKEIVECIYELQRKGQRGLLRGFYSISCFLLIHSEASNICLVNFPSFNIFYCALHLSFLCFAFQFRGFIMMLE